MTIVPTDKIQNDPQRLLYHFPGMHPVQYTKMSQEYNFWRCVAIAEETAKMFGRQLIPARCLHWERKLRCADRRIQIGKNSFFALSMDELTKVEKEKYLAEIKQVKEIKKEA